MPAKSKAQKIAMCMALAARKGDLEVSKLKGAALEIYKSDMTNKEIEDFTILKENNICEYIENRNMKSLQQHINETLLQNITEAKKNPLLDKEIKTDEFELGDIVLYKDFFEEGDEYAIMVVIEPKGNRCDVSLIGTRSILGSTHTLLSRDLFKVGHTTVKKIGRSFDIDIEDVLNQCEEIGMDVTIPRENELYRAKHKYK